MTSIDFNQLYTTHFNRLSYIAYSITKDRMLAEDVVQESFIKAYKKMEAVEDVNKIGAWLSSIVTRTAIDFLRTEKRKKSVTEDPSIMECVYDQTSTEEEVFTHFLLDDISRLLKKLSVEYQIILVLKIFHGLKEKEIAHILQLNLATVKTRVHRARKQLRDYRDSSPILWKGLIAN